MEQQLHKHDPTKAPSRRLSVADELCPSPPLLKEQLSLGPAATYGLADARGLALLGSGDEAVAWRPRGDGGGAHRILQLGLNLAADERPLISALGTTTRVESVAFLQGNACSIHNLAEAPGTPGIIHDFDGRASSCTSMGRVLIVGDASGKLHRLDANGFAVVQR